MDRYCPNCKVKLGEYDHFFCTTCGFVLPNDLVRREGVSSRVANFAKISSKSKKEDKKAHITAGQKKGIATLFLFTVLLLAFFLIQDKLITLFLNKTQKAPDQSDNISYTKNVLEVPLNWSVNTFGTDRIMEYVPYDADIVVEGNDLNALGVAYSQLDAGYTDLYKFYKPKIQQGYIDQHFAFFANKIGKDFVWSLIYYPIGATSTIPGDLIQKYSWLKFWKNDPIVLITPDDGILTKVADAKGKTAKNFTHTKMYSVSRLGLPRNGKLLIFVTTPEAKQYLKTVVGLPKLSPELKKVVESIVESNSDFSVIL